MKETRIRTAALVLLGGALLASLAWLVMARAEVPVDAANANALRAEAAPAAAIESLPSAHDGDARETPSPALQRDVAEEAIATTGSGVLRVRLRGLHPDAPWTAPLTLALFSMEAQPHEQRHSATVHFDAAGQGEARVPPRFVAAAAHVIAAEADDPLYRSVREQGCPIDPADGITIDVAPIGVVQGRVVDARGKPVPYAVVTALVTHGDTVLDDVLGTAHAEADGTFALRPPPDVAMRVIAVREGSGSRLLPGSTATIGRAGKITRLPNLVLADAAAIRGIVQWRDGTPIARAQVRLGGGAFPALAGERRSAFAERDGQSWSMASVLTDDAGRFELAAPRGVSMDVELFGIANYTTDGVMLLRAGADADVDEPVTFVVPKPVSLRATRDNDVQQAATLVSSDGRPRWLQARPCVFLQARRVRAELGTLCSDWVTVGPDTTSEEIVLPLLGALTAVSLRFTGAEEWAFAVATWSDGRGREGTANLPLRNRLLTLCIEPGRWHVVVRATRVSDLDRRGEFAVPVETTIDVGGAALLIDLAIQRAGVLRVIATDANGRHVRGHCHVIDRTGVDRATTFGITEGRMKGHEGERGELLPFGPNDSSGIAPGDYELQFEFAGFGERRERCTIRAGETTEVHVRL